METIKSTSEAENVVRVLEETLLKQMTTIVHTAVANAVVAASRTRPPTLPGAPTAQATASAPRSAAPAAPVTPAPATPAPAGKPHKPGRCKIVHETLDAMHRAAGAVPTLKQVMTISRRKRWNENNTRVEYYNWRRAHGIHGRSAAKLLEGS
jgi:hypothetical protein